MYKYLVAALLAAFFVTAAQAQDAAVRYGILKVCKIASSGVAPGTYFSYTANWGNTSTNFQVPAGSQPGGNCWVAAAAPVNTTVHLAELIPPGVSVVSITRAPNVSMTQTGPGSVDVVLGQGVTEVTYTNRASGYLEICKVTGEDVKTGTPFTFTLNPGGSVTVPSWSCSPAIQVPAGSVTITETPTGGLLWTNCIVWQPASASVTQCAVNSQSATVNVTAGDISAQSIVIVYNLRRDHPGGPSTDARSVQDLMKTLQAPPPAP